MTLPRFTESQEKNCGLILWRVRTRVARKGQRKKERILFSAAMTPPVDAEDPSRPSYAPDASLGWKKQLGEAQPAPATA